AGPGTTLQLLTLTGVEEMIRRGYCLFAPSRSCWCRPDLIGLGSSSSPPTPLMFVPRQRRKWSSNFSVNPVFLTHHLPLAVGSPLHPVLPSARNHTALDSFQASSSRLSTHIWKRHLAPVESQEVFTLHDSLTRRPAGLPSKRARRAAGEVNGGGGERTDRGMMGWMQE
ncbi:unnamed protein product, partial [Pleuronectes platessa]